MNMTEKLAMAIPVMRAPLCSWCQHLLILDHVAKHECENSPALQTVIKHLAEMHEKVRSMCNAYDKLRSVVGALELEQGVGEPRFYVDKQAGIVPKYHCPVLNGSE